MAKTPKTEVIKEYRAHEKDTGSTEVQVALLTKAINDLVGHLKVHKKDFHTRYGLLLKVGRRRRMLKYLKGKNPGKYNEIIKKLEIKG